MAGHELLLTRDVDAPPEAIWRVLTDLDNAPRNLSQVVSIERIGGDGYGPGTRWRETRTMFGRSEAQEMWVESVDPPRATVVRAQAGGVDYTTTFEVTPRDGGSRITMRFAGAQQAPSVLQRLAWTVLGPIGMRVTRKAMQGDLDDIAAAAESLN
ncbi:carbon monoxide dehydrogenase subunit G [Kineosphaera limosa]|uniref:Carbon monoxide dehydrogenase subunit G n=1 Tax=Kineosphaera limosa NBRC 100340 TaxID=1184609 RepID=K6X830_9MICO|nr:SRPBCC family protein [Kineosphaera limosa]NYE00570.1 carbon monoxide dehydrogenase subunit G [Kineosphaera limosa]GAB94964.1 hypothetical protein KILIM_015_00240 [Kineosphaera limosa NBRC 100340]